MKVIRLLAATTGGASGRRRIECCALVGRIYITRHRDWGTCPSPAHTHTHSQQIPQQTLFQLNLWSVRGIIASWGKKNIENDKRRLGRMEEHRHAGLWNGGPNNLPSVVMIRIAGLSAYRQCEEARRSQLEIQTIGLNRRAAKLRSPSSSLLRCKPFLAWSLRDQRYNKVA